MNRPIIMLALVAISCFWLSEPTQAYDNPRYKTTAARPDGSIDTVGILTCRPDPAYMQTSVLDIEFIILAPIKDSVRIYLRSGQICNFRWDKYEHTWYGDFQPGDTLRCSFEFTPLTVGTMGVAFGLIHGHRWGTGLGFGFTLDETGVVIPGELGQGEKHYGLMGPEPSLIGDSFIVNGHCYVSGDFCIRMSMSPPLGPDQYSKIVYTIVPTSDHDLGTFFLLSYHDMFDVILEDSTDWLQPVYAGDTLTVRVLVKPLKPGIGEINLSLSGFTPLKTPSSNMGVDHGGETNSGLSVKFAIDGSLRQIAYSRNPLPLNMPASTINDAHRLPAIQALPVMTKWINIFSKNWETKKQLDREFR